jgi:hypothetical protein
MRSCVYREMRCVLFPSDQSNKTRKGNAADSTHIPRGCLTSRLIVVNMCGEGLAMMLTWTFFDGFPVARLQREIGAMIS